MTSLISSNISVLADKEFFNCSFAILSDRNIYLGLNSLITSSALSTLELHTKTFFPVLTKVGKLNSMNSIKAFLKKAKPKIRLSAALRKRSKELSRSMPGVELAGVFTSSGYAQILRAWVMKFYVLPDADYSAIKNEAKLRVILDRKGVIKSLKVVKSSASTYFDKIAMRILKQASPFPLPPRDWVGKEITFPFSGVK
mgnify:CR=1 FL=1